MANSKQKALAKAVKTGTYKPSSIGSKARAAASKLQSMTTSQAQDNVTKLSESRHLQSQQFGGKHHAPSAQGARKNAFGTSYTGKHRAAEKFNWFSKAA